MADWMPWIIMVVVVFGSLSVLAITVVVLARTVFRLSAKISELSLRKKYYLCEVEKGARGISRVVIGEPDIQQEDDALPDLPPDPDEIDVGSR